MEQLKTISYNEFVEQYRPIQNPFTKEGSYDNTMFETYGQEAEYVLKQSNNNVWTNLSFDNEESWLVPGFHFVNRMFYIVTEIPWKNEDENSIQVNDNEMINIKNAINHCIEFFKTINVELNKEEVSEFYRSNEPLYHDMFTMGAAKYLAIEFYEEKFDELSDSQQDSIHDYYSQL